MGSFIIVIFVGSPGRTAKQALGSRVIDSAMGSILGKEIIFGFLLGMLDFPSDNGPLTFNYLVLNP